MKTQVTPGPVSTGFTSDEITARLEQIHYAGQLDQGEGPRIAVIGARASSTYGEHVAAELATDIAAHDMCLVATFGYGIGSAALRGALAAGGRVVGVAAQSLDVIYPKGTAVLQERVIAHGHALTVYPEAHSPTRQQFLMTHAILAHIVDAIVVVEADLRSTTFITVNEARRIGRPVYAVPGPIYSAVSRGTNELIRNGTAQILTHFADLELPRHPRDTAA